MKKCVLRFRSFLLSHFKNKKIRQLIYDVISYEMLRYMGFGLMSMATDYLVFSLLTAMGMAALLSNIISTIAATIFAYVTNKILVFKSKTSGFLEVMSEFIHFSYVRIGTLIMTEIILFINHLLGGNVYITKLVALILTIIINYLLTKFFIFNKKKGINKNVQKKDDFNRHQKQIF